MARDDLGCILVPPCPSYFDQMQANGRYLTCIGGNCTPVGVVFPIDGEVTAVTAPDIPVEHWLACQDWVTDIRKIPGWSYVGDIMARLAELPAAQRKRIGVTGLKDTTRAPDGTVPPVILDALRSTYPDAELVNATPLMDEARFVKSDEELGFIERSIQIVESAIEVLAAEARVGVPERVVYGRMYGHMIEQGSDIPTMILWSAGWPQLSGNHYMPTSRLLQAGDMLLLEIEARWGGYIGQVTQPAFLGPIPQIYEDLWAVQQEAVARCYEVLRPGSTIGDILTAAAKAGEGTPFECSVIMHGKGLGDDAPIAIRGTRDERMRSWPIEANSAFMVKPFVQPREGAPPFVYRGDTVVATPQGARRLGKRPAEILQISA